MKRLLLCAGIIVLASSVTALGAPSVEMIPPLSGTAHTTTVSNAITPDGLYVVGNSYVGTDTRGYLYPVGSASPVWVLSSDNAGSAVANGVGYRTSGGQQEMIISGTSSGYVTEWMTSTGGASFGVKRRNTSYTLNNVAGANQLGSLGTDDAYYVTSRNSTQLQLDINRGTGAWPATITTSAKSVTTQARMQGIGGAGYAVGSRVDATGRRNYRMDFNPAGSPFNIFFNGLATGSPGLGEAYDVSDDGLSVAGWSPVGASTTNSNAYKATFANPGTSTLAWVRTDMLPETGLESGSTTRTVAYGISPDGRYLVGGSYQGTWHAMLWDTADPNPANWTYTDLWNLAQANGIMDGFIRLERGFSVGVQSGTGYPVVAGNGIWSPDGGTTLLTRGFVMVVPEPATLGLLLLGLPLLRRRRA